MPAASRLGPIENCDASSCKRGRWHIKNPPATYSALFQVHRSQINPRASWAASHCENFLLYLPSLLRRSSKQV